MSRQGNRQNRTTIAVSSEVKRVLDEFKSLMFLRSYDDVIRFLIEVYAGYERSMVSTAVKSFICSKFSSGASISYQGYVKLVVDNVINRLKNPLLAVRESVIVVEAMKYVKPLPEEGMITVDMSRCREQ